jgi:hypothetical protein
LLYLFTFRLDFVEFLMRQPLFISLKANHLHLLIFGSSVSEIAHTAFRGCASLTTVIIKEDVTDLQTYAFADCTSLSRPIRNTRPSKARNENFKAESPDFGTFSLFFKVFSILSLPCAVRARRHADFASIPEGGGTSYASDGGSPESFYPHRLSVDRFIASLRGTRSAARRRESERSS